MRAANLKSSMIRRIAYDEDDRLLTVWFKDSGRYLYRQVPRAIYDALCRAPSAGSYFNAFVKGRYPCTPDPERKRFRPVA